MSRGMILFAKCMALALLLITILSIFFPHTEPAPSSQETQEKNLEILKSVQKHDLITCYINGAVREVVLVKGINDKADYFEGVTINENNVSYLKAYPYSHFAECAIEIQRDDTNGVMPQFPAAIGRIILYGLNPPPAK